MALRTPDLIRETTTTTGTGNYTTTGALPGMRAMSSTLTPGDTFFYKVQMGILWEIGLGTYISANVVQRTSIILSTNSNNAVNWAAGTKVLLSVAPEALLDMFFRKDGGTITGDVTIDKALGLLIFNSAGVSNKGIQSRVANLLRWQYLLTAGANSDMALYRYDDAGVLLGTAFTIFRLTGEAAIGGAPRAGTAFTIRTTGVDVDGRGIYIQNNDNSVDSSTDIQIAGASGAGRARFRGQRVGATLHGKAVISAYLSGIEVEVASFNPDGSIVHIPTGNKVDAFPSGTRLLFQQSTAPVGWVKDTTRNERALRVVSGSVSDGGTFAFSSIFTSRGLSGAVAGHVLTWGQMPNHTHTWPALPGAVVTTAAGSGNIGSGMGGASQIPYTNFGLSYEGGNEGHGHGLFMNNLEMSVLYTDVIIAQKA